jgi:hypothetical protein
MRQRRFKDGAKRKRGCCVGVKMSKSRVEGRKRSVAVGSLDEQLFWLCLAMVDFRVLLGMDDGDRPLQGGTV